MKPKLKLSRAKPAIDAESSEFYDKFVKEYDLTTAGLELLKVACDTLSRWRSAKLILDDEGVVIQSGNLSRIHPAAKVEHDARLSFCRMLKELNLDHELRELQDE